MGNFSDTGNAAPKKPEGNIAQRIMGFVAGCMTPLLPAMLGTGMVKVLLTLLTTFGLMSSTGPTYTFLYGMADSFFYFLPGITNGLQGYMRAIGKMKLTMYVTYGQMLTRAVCTYLLIGAMKLDAVPLACAAGWVLMVVWEVGLIVYWRRKGNLYQ